MKVLLDENIPRKLKYRFSEGFEILTVPDMGWSGIKNGDLLKRMNEKEINVLISLDKNMSHQQSLEKFNVSLIILDSINSIYSNVLRFIPKIENLLIKELKPKLYILDLE